MSTKSWMIMDIMYYFTACVCVLCDARGKSVLNLDL